MAKINGGELVVQTLQAAGVDTIFGLHGAHIDAIFQACLDHEIPIIDTRHEAAAGHAAEGYARASGRLGVSLVTAGGGLTNVVTSMANALLDRTPVLYIAGSGAVRDDETNTLQAGIDQVAICTPVTKWAHRVLATDQIPRMVAQAIRIALTAPRGPVLLDIPWDILLGEVDMGSVPVPASIPQTLGARPQSYDIDAVLDILEGAQRPIIVIGSEAARGSAGDAIAALAASTGIPVFSDFEGLSCLTSVSKDYSCGLIQGLYGWAQHGLAPDAVLLLGTRFGLNTVHGSGRLLPLDARIAQIDPDARELGRLQAIAHGIVADVAAAAQDLAVAAHSRAWPDRAGWRGEAMVQVAKRRAAVGAGAKGSGALHPFTASEIVARHVGPETVVVADGALTYLWLSEVIAEARPAAFLCHGYLGSMGVGFGTAIGAQMACKTSGLRTILVTGDGSVGYSIAEFDTAVRHRLPLIVIVMNNRSWGATLHFQQIAVGQNRVTNTRLENGAYDGVASAFGADGYSVTNAAEFEAALNQALASDRPACIDVRVELDPIPPEELILIGKDPFD